MFRYSLLLAVITAFILQGCRKSEIMTWNEKGRVWFSTVDPVLASFKYQPASASELTAEIKISLAGSVSGQDREVAVEVLKDARNPATRYTIQRPVIVPAGVDSAVFKVKVFKTDNLAGNPDSVNFVIRPSAQLETGLIENLQCALVMTNRYAQPWWWYDLTCGLYSESKHEVLFAVFNSDKDIRGTGTDANFRRGWSGADAVYNLYLLNKYCEEKGYAFRFADGK